MKSKNVLSKILAFVMSIIMVFGSMPLNLFAVEISLEEALANDGRTNIVSFELLPLYIGEQIVPFNTAESELNLPLLLYATVHIPPASGGDPEEVEFYEIPVYWFSSPPFDGREPGDYIFTPTFDNTVFASAVSLPTILVTVERESVFTEVVALEQFPATIRTQTVPLSSAVSDIDLPQTIVATLRHTFSDLLAPHPT